MHSIAKLGTLRLLVIVLALLPLPTAAFQQPQSAVPAPSEPSAVKAQNKDADALVMRVRALRWLDRDKEALDLAETASPDVKARLSQYIESTGQFRGSQWAVENAQQSIKKNASVPTNLGHARIVLGEYDAAVKARSEAIHSQERYQSTVAGDPKINYWYLSSDYLDRAVASSAAGNRIGSQRDFQTALDLCGKADCERLSEANIYFGCGQLSSSPRRPIQAGMIAELSRSLDQSMEVPSGIIHKKIRKRYVLAFSGNHVRKPPSASQPIARTLGRIAWAAKLSGRPKRKNFPPIRKHWGWRIAQRDGGVRSQKRHCLRFDRVVQRADRAC